VAVTNELLARGRQRYDMFCAPCHGRTGDGNGITKQYGMGATPTYHDERIRSMPEGEIYNTIANGKNTMMGYGDRLVVTDRWAIVAYLRALQRAQQGTVDDVKSAYRPELGL
jgi:mono/diheme cytochrome c family protein